MAKGFRLNRLGIASMGHDPRLGAHLGRIAKDAANEVNRRNPHPQMLGGIEARGLVERRAMGYEGEVRVEGPGWHLWEWGTVNHGARPYIRPGVQAAISRHKGRLGL